jgi:UDP-glucuronate decarboxylase
VVSNFIVQALTGQPITLYGDGLQTRAFCHVSDTVEALLRLMFDTPEDFNGPVNIGNPHECSMREIAERVLDITGSRSCLAFQPLPADDPRQRCPDITLARRMLGWQPRVALREGLLDTVAWFRAHLGDGLQRIRT